MFHRTLVILSSVFVLLSLLAVPATAQEEAYGEAVAVDEVLVDVVVEDRRGNVVLGLGAEDFVVTDEGQDGDVTGVTFYSNRRFLESDSQARAMGIDPDAVPTDRYFILVFHDQAQLLPRLNSQLLEAGRQAKRWAQSELSPNDYVAVFRYDFSLDLIQDFTSDPEAVVQAIDDAVAGQDGVRENPADAPQLAPPLPTGDELSEITPRIYAGLELIAQAAQTIPGRKNLIFYSIGFGEVNEAGFYTPDRRYYPDMVHALNDANVAAYTVDLIPSGAFGVSRTRLSNSLSNLSADTGGTYYHTFTNFLTPLEQIEADNNGYYLISYERPAGLEPGTYREIDVETTNPRLRVHARQGYVVDDDGS